MGKQATFAPDQQATNTSSKIVVALERLSEVFRVLLWDNAKQYGISPIQIQVLTFLLHNPVEQRTVTYLAAHFNMTKATISDAVKSLESKNYLVRKITTADTRSHTLHLAKAGKTLAKKVECFAFPLQHTLSLSGSKEQSALLEQLLQLIFQLNRQGIISPQRMCLNCQFYTQKGGHYCNLVPCKLKPADLRVDCPQFQFPE
jgi:DNA-binding MarR family transcriptional regulator